MKLSIRHYTTSTTGILCVMLTVLCLLNSATVYSQVKENTQQGEQLTLKFNLMAGRQHFSPGNTYTNPFGESYTVEKFRFYITQVQLQDSSDMSVQFFPNDYFLIDAGDTSTQTITIPLSLKKITSISFLLGVDSVTNVSSVQTGALDPVNGMFWTWNTGYIMLKLQATSPAAQVPANQFTFDVGGYKQGENAARKIGFLLKHKHLIHSLTLNVDVDKLFNSVHPVKIAEHPMCHEPGPLAMQLADNYATMFSIGEMQ
ncbi:MAG TPA: MbnP family protein [Chitinophagaceae bacterium]|nr:MbnP family protein [Chitinophagaceae bacterium]